MERFNIRVYGILINESQQILISDELYQGQQFSKFPGGGLELGEGIIECLKREFLEEFDLPIESVNLMHITQGVITSAFDNSQVVGIYYQVFTNEDFIFPIKDKAFDFGDGEEQALRWIPLEGFDSDVLTFEMDREAWASIRDKVLI